jgi:hypothetical protein
MNCQMKICVFIGRGVEDRRVMMKHLCLVQRQILGEDSRDMKSGFLTFDMILVGNSKCYLTSNPNGSMLGQNSGGWVFVHP